MKTRKLLSTTVVVMASVLLLGVATQSIAQNRLDAFQASHQACKEIKYRGCVKLTDKSAKETLRSFIEGFPVARTDVVLEANGWGTDMLDVDIPPGFFFKVFSTRSYVSSNST